MIRRIRVSLLAKILLSTSLAVTVLVAVTGYLVRNDRQEMILRKIESQPLSEAVADAQRSPERRGFIEPRRRQPAILNRPGGALEAEQVDRAGDWRHPRIEDESVGRVLRRSDGR